MLSADVWAGRARVAVIVALLAAAAVGVLISTSSTTPSRSSTGWSSGSGATMVSRRDLVETDTEWGTLSYAGSHTVYNRQPRGARVQPRRGRRR